MSGRPAGDPVRLVVLGDSLAFTDDTGPQLPAEPTLYPNVVARTLEASLGRPVDVAVLARPGATVRETARLVTKDRHVQFEVLAHADAVIVGVGSFDHAPIGIPPSIESLVPYLRPAAVRRRVRAMLRAAYPRLVRVTGGRRTRTPPREFERLFGQLLRQVTGLGWGRAAGVVLGPTSHRSDYYGRVHPHHPRSERLQARLAGDHGFAFVAAWELVAPAADDLNPDGIHWPARVHEEVGVALARALLEQFEGVRPRPPLPDLSGPGGEALP